jgi:predicted aspartyl protease
VAAVPLPQFSGGCGASSVPAGGHATIPAKFVRQGVSASSAAQIVVGVCVNGEGPFTFLVDTGASLSYIDSGLAKRLHIPAVGEAVNNSSLGCNRTVRFVSGPRLSIGGVALDTQPVGTGTVASPSTPGLNGLIGSDILSRFGEVRIDFARQQITVGQEGSEPQGAVSHPQPNQVDSTLRVGTVTSVRGTTQAQRVDIPGDVSQSITYVYLQVPVEVKGESETFVVDTGAAQSAVSETLAKRAGKAAGKPRTVYAGLSCPFQTGPYLISDWRLGDATFAPQLAGTAPLPSEWDGLIGSGTLQRYSPVVVDFADGFLLLGPASERQS